MTYISDVTSWCNAVQFRYPPSNEIVQYVSELQNGVSATKVQEQIIKSDYTLNYVNPIIREYQAAFNSVPDQEGEDYWVNQYGQGLQSIGDISNTFANTDVFYSLYQAHAATPLTLRVIDAFYTNALGRAPNKAEEQYWLNSGLNTAQLLATFSQSAEMATKVADSISSYQFTEIAKKPQTVGPLFTNPYAEFNTTGITRFDGVNSYLISPQ